MLTEVTFATADKVFRPPNDAARANLLVDWSLGVDPDEGISGGVRALTWQCSYFGGAVQIRNNSATTWQALRTLANVTELSLAFDSRGWIVLAYVQAGVAYVSWLNNALVWVDVALGSGAIGPMVAQAGAQSAPDNTVGVTVAYLRGGHLCCRNDQNAYLTETQLAVAPTSSTRVQRIGMSTGDEFLIELDGDTRAVTAVVQDVLTDSYYCAVGAQVLPLFRGSRVTGLWRSKILPRNHAAAFSYLRLDGPFESAVVRIYGDGTLRYTTPAITSNMPVRLPPGRYRETEFELESDGVVTALVLANSAEELRGT